MVVIEQHYKAWLTWVSMVCSSFQPSAPRYVTRYGMDLGVSAVAKVAGLGSFCQLRNVCNSFSCIRMRKSCIDCIQTRPNP